MTDQRRLRRRYRAERRFEFYGLLAVLVALAALVVLLGTLLGKGLSAFHQTHLRLDVTFAEEVLDRQGTRAPEVLWAADYGALVKRALGTRFPDVATRRDRRALARLLSSGAQYALRDMVLADPAIIGETLSIELPASDDIDMLHKGQLARDIPEARRKVSDQQIAWFDSLAAQGAVASRFNVGFFSGGDSREPELAGIWSAVLGSFWMMAVCVALAVPIGVMAAVYLEEFAPRNRWTDAIEVNINNLAAVPSIIFGLLGLAVFLSFLGLPRSAPLVGGMVLALMTLPTVIIAGRAAIKAVPPSIREAALGVGASPVQVVVHHVLPLAMPGIMTGTIIGLARALGETAPLLMIGMVAFIVDAPGGPLDASTALPVQVYLWADSPERAFVEKTSAAILVLLGFLIAMNGFAVFLRNRFERRW